MLNGKMKSIVVLALVALEIAGLAFVFGIFYVGHTLNLI